ncbi:MAG: hypothetical protein AAB381_00730 [Patescibacteria group bacterium]
MLSYIACHIYSTRTYVASLHGLAIHEEIVSPCPYSEHNGLL